MTTMRACVELRAFPRGVARRKDTLTVGDAARLDCPYPHRSSGDAASVRFHWSRVTSELDRSPVRVIPDDRRVVGLDGKFPLSLTSVPFRVLYRTSVDF